MMVRSPRLRDVVDASLVYSYGPDGDRIKTVSTPTGGTAYVGYQLGDTRIGSTGLNSKVPHPDIRIVGSDSCVVNRDHLGSIRTETDATKTVQLRLRCASFGLRTQDYQGTGCTIEDRAFIGERYETNRDLIDLNARWYDPITGVFLTPDWLDPVDGDTARAANPSAGATTPSAPTAMPMPARIRSTGAIRAGIEGSALA